MHWSKNGKAFTPEELALHLKIIVPNQRSRSIPTNPPVFLPVQKVMLKIGIQAPDVVPMDVYHLETSDKLKQHARRTRLEREAVGVDNIYSGIQPTSAPSKYKGLIGKCLDVCLQYFLGDGGTELLCIQGEVILVPYGTIFQRIKVYKHATRLLRLSWSAGTQIKK